MPLIRAYWGREWQMITEKQISKMERLISTAEKPQTLADLYPSEIEIKGKTNMANAQKEIENVTLYDVLYACVTAEASYGG